MLAAAGRHAGRIASHRRWKAQKTPREALRAQPFSAPARRGSSESQWYGWACGCGLPRRGCHARGAPVPCTIFMAEPMRADTSVMLLGTMRVVVASAATWL